MATIAIAGASGFVGSHLIQRLLGKHTLVALGRSLPNGVPVGVEWRVTDLFSMQSTFEALRGVDVAIYLVHSMMPSSMLFQGSFHDTDLLLADNFAQACAANGVKQVIYLGGLLPLGYVSPHLQSRFEVEGVLRSTGVPTTVLRAGMIVGPGGSSFEILRSLVERLPFMILPRWTQRTTQAIFIDDVINTLEGVILGSKFFGKNLDVVNGESLTYQDLLKRMAAVLGLDRPMFAVPISSTRFSKLWVTVFGKSTYELVSPLIDSLLCDLPQMQIPENLERFIHFRGFEAMVLKAVKDKVQRPSVPPKRRIRMGKSVRSIQRLPKTPHRDCHWIAREYMQWVPRSLPFLIRVRTSEDGKTVAFYLTFFWKPLLVLKHIQGQDDARRKKFFIVDGVLTQTVNTGWLEFRQINAGQYTLVALHEFVPSLPWLVYIITQAQFHKAVMYFFSRHLLRFP